MDQRTLPKPLRLWPGVIAVVLLLVARVGVKAVVPGFAGFALGMKWTFPVMALVVVWWTLFSRARWLERLSVLALMILGLGGAWTLGHESMGPLWLFAYALPTLCIALVAGAAATRRFSDHRRFAAISAVVLFASGAWTLVRMNGISGDHVADFGWRWAKSSEERLLAEADRRPAASGSAAPLETRVEPRPASADEVPAPRPAAAKSPSVPAVVHTPVDWPGFRGPGRDGVSRGVRIDTNWAASPPVELWRRPIGPGWSSFAVRGDLLYTQEQRGEEEVVACYSATTGAEVWTHRDAVRFFESNGGAGPRGTPTLSDGRVYTFGATGIVNALDADDGAVVWSRNAASDAETEIPTWGFSSSPLVVGDVVIVAVSGRLVAYDLATGRPRWKGPAGGVSYSSPQLATIDGVAQVVLIGATGVTSVVPADGKRLWDHPWRGFPIVQPAVTADGDVLISASTDSGTRRIALAHGPSGWTAQERWTSRSLKPYFNDFVVHEGHAFGFDGRILACIDLRDGARKWKGGRFGNGQLVLLPDQDLLLVLSEEGELALVNARPDQFIELARFKAIEGKTWNHPVLVGSMLVVRNGEEMAAFRLPRGKR
ncbi:MAG TPA: PQQ-binding-like beta-propeller repeat protein [Vicinamibacterales bacterium]|jgi:outer membrane protein assembly factor BamB|nr:PQQ-binding-like beta-propeller repeat protein [Vicinamibacterales bacterium]